MTKPKYATAEERRAATSAQAKKQMLAHWERKRAEQGQAGPGYFGCHRRVRTNRGRAAARQCVECGTRAKDWSHVHGTDPADPQNYRPLCRDCHWAYDGVGAKTTATKGPEGRRALAVLAWSRRTPEERRAIGLKAAETRRKNAEARSVASADPLDGDR